MPHAYREGDKPVPGYTLIKFLGRGGFGQVWQAHAPGGTKVAFKIIDLEGKQGLKEFRAVRLMRNVLHPNLVPIMAFWLKDDMGTLLEGTVGEDGETNTFLKSKAAELLIAMGLGEKNLLDRLKECRHQGKQGIPADELLEYIEAAARAVDFLNSTTHDMGDGRPVAIHHCDIKPQNILIVGGAAQVCDFGLAREMGASRSTSPSVSIAYTPPELLDGRSSPGTDQYSLAVTYIELRTGVLPFSSENPAAMIYAHLQGRLDLSKLTPAERRIITRATSLEPKDRYKTNIEMVRALREALAPSQNRPQVEAGEPSWQLAAGREIVPGYRLLKSLGSGSYGAVWEAVGPGGTRMAFKIIQELDQAAGQQEYKALELIKGVEHKYLMEIFAYWLLDSAGRVIPDELRGSADAPKPATLVIASKLAKSNLGLKLKECLALGQHGIPVQELLRYMDQTARAIDYLNAAKHRMGDKFVAIQHRDIKPENILLTANDDVKIADFGLAKVVEGLSTVIHTRSMGLTPYYAAPEMFDGRITRWTDQYCLAVSYCHLRTGVLPFRQVNSVQDIMRAHLQGSLDLGRLPIGERKVIARALAVNPEERYPSCCDMVADLISACQDKLEAPIDESFMGVSSPPVSEKKPPRRSGPERPAVKPVPPTTPIDPAPRAPRPASTGRERPPAPAPVAESAENFPTLSQPAPSALEEPMLIPGAYETDKPRGTAPLRPFQVVVGAVVQRLALWRLSRRAKLTVAVVAGIVAAATVGWWAISVLSARSARSAVVGQIDAGNFGDAWRELQRREFDAATKQDLLTRWQTALHQQAAAAWQKVTADEDVVSYQRVTKLLADAPQEGLNAETKELLEQVQGSSAQRRAESCLQRGADQLDLNPTTAQMWYTRAEQWSKFADGKLVPAAVLGRARAAIREHPPAWEKARKDWAALESAAASLSDTDRLYATAIGALGRNAAGGGDVLDRLQDLPRIERFPPESSEEKQLVLAARTELLKQVRAEFEEAELPRARAIANYLKQDDPKATGYADVVSALSGGDAARIKNLLAASPKPPRFAALCDAYVALAEKQAEKQADSATIQEMATTLAAALKAEWPGKETRRKELLDRQSKLMNKAVAARITAKLDQASGKLEKREYSDCRKILQELDKESLKADDQKRRDTLRALVLRADAKSAGEKKQAADLCLHLLARGGTNRQADLCLALADLADQSGELLGDAVATLKAVNGHLTDKDQLAVERRYGPLVAKYFGQLADQAYDKLGNRAEFDRLIKEAEAHEQEVQGAALRLTALRILADAKDRPSRDTVGQIEQLLADTKIPYLLDLCRAYAGLREKEMDVDAWAKAARTLRDAGSRLTTDADKKEIGRLEAGFLARHITAMAAGTAPHQAQALTEFRAIPLENVPKQRLGEMCQALMALAKQDLKQFGDAGQGKLKAAVNGVDGAAGKQLRDQLAQLIGAGVKVVITTAASYLESGEFARCRTTLEEALATAAGEDKTRIEQLKALLDLRDTDAASKRNRTAAIQAAAKHFARLDPELKNDTCKALAHLVEREPDTVRAIAAALTDVRTDLPAKWSNLPAYVRIRELADQPEAIAAEAAQMDLSPVALDGLGAPRRQFIASKLEGAADRLRAGSNWLQPFGDNAANADQAFIWLKQARKLLPNDVQANPPVNVLRLRLNLALASWHKPGGTEADAAQARLLAGELLKEHPREDASFTVTEALPLLLVHAQACAASVAKDDRLAALDSYARLVALLEALNQEARVPPLYEYKEVLEPALKVGELSGEADASEAARIKAAGIYSYTGEFLNQQVYLPVWADLKPPLKVEQKVFECHRRAFDLVKNLKGVDNNTKARYLIDKVHARMHFAAEYKLDEMLAEAGNAKDLAPDLPGGLGMVGYVIHQQARNEADPSRQRRYLTDAIDRYKEAISKCQAKGGFVGEQMICLYNSSIAHGDLASIADPESEAKRDELYQAVADAEQAVQLLKTTPKQRNPEFAHMQLGAALEALAQFGDAYFDRFEVALAEYKEAAELTKDRKSGSKAALLAHGRCLFLQAKDRNSGAVERNDRLATAQKELKDVSTSALGTDEEARAHYWLAQVYALQGKPNMKESDAEFTNARRVAVSLPEKKVIADSWRRQAELAIEQAERVKDEPAVVRERLVVAVKCGREIANLDERVAYSLMSSAATLALETAKLVRPGSEARPAWQAIVKDSTEIMANCTEIANAKAVAALLLGNFYNDVANEPLKAIEAYGAGLPPKNDPVSTHVVLQVRRNFLLLIPAMKGQRNINQLIKSADTAAEWALRADVKADPILQSDALGCAGFARARAMAALHEMDESLEEYKKATEYLEKAIKIAPTNPQNGWIHRFWAAYSYYKLVLAEKNNVQRKKYVERALELTDEAKRFEAPDPVSKNDLTSLEEALKKEAK